MRKNLLIGLSQREAPVSAEAARADYANRGASRSMIQSIEEMAENAKRMMEGEAIVALDTGLIDASFVADRMEDDPAEFALFRDGIAKDGQLQPVLVRPHPQAVGRYMVVFGHRRVRAARELGIGVRAVVKNVEAIAHVIAQGQENSRRSNLSFVEKALFAKKLRDMGQGKETVKSALGVDDTLLSRMLAVADGVPTKLVDAIGAAKGVGRDRWEELKKRVLKPADAEKALVIAAEPGFAARDGKGRI
ncbi:MAG: plasmid partitioning protein RepB, partial [Hyphomicrobiales bacterium]|nr:plasmid partitioning protein RepB [Hyphomicrobiales bacterium]